MSNQSSDFELVSLNRNQNDFKFGEYLRSVRKAKKLSIRTLAKAVEKTPTYLSDIENGNNKPPDVVLLEKIIKELKIDDYPIIKNNLFDLAALDRGDIPADIKEYLKNHKRVLNLLRIIKEIPDADKVLMQFESIVK